MQTRKTERVRPQLGGRSPWGRIDHIEKLADGILHVSTPEHGGAWLSQERLDAMRLDERSADGWYEEDCEMAFVIRRFADEIEMSDDEYMELMVRVLSQRPFSGYRVNR